MDVGMGVIDSLARHLNVNFNACVLLNVIWEVFDSLLPLWLRDKAKFWRGKYLSIVKSIVFVIYGLVCE